LAEAATQYAVKRSAAPHAAQRQPLPRAWKQDGDFTDREWMEALDEVCGAEESTGARARRVAFLLGPAVAASAEQLADLHAGLKTGFAPAQVDVAKGFKAELPHLAPLRDASRRLHWEMAYAAAIGDIPRAVVALDTTFALTEALRDEPFVISQLVRLAMIKNAADATCHALSLAEFPDSALRHVEAVFAAADDPSILTRMMEFERCMGFSAYEQQRTVPGLLYEDNPGGLQGFAFDKLRVIRNLNGSTATDRERYFQRSTEAIAASQLPYPEMFASAKTQRAKPQSDSSWDLGVADDLMASFHSVAGATCRNAAVVRAAATIAAVERYRLNTGTLPEDLAGMPPANLDCMPEDPYDGKPLRYRKELRGFIVYSVGDNLKDEDGVVSREYAQGDVVLRVAR
jgi:hypothetical protein